jgi:hypothetical protein
LTLIGTYQEKISHLNNSLQKFTRLRELDLSRNFLNSLDGLENLKNLEKLNLYYNNISSLKDLEKLRFNTELTDLDLRLNPVTKEENDYRLFLINMIPSLKVLDDRPIRETEKQMASTCFQTPNNNNNGYKDQKLKNSEEYESNNAISARVKSVNNILKRSVGIDGDYIDNDKFQSYLNINCNNKSETDKDKQLNNNIYKQPLKLEQYSPRTLRELGNLESRKHKLAAAAGTTEIYSVQQNESPPNFVRSKSFSMQNLNKEISTKNNDELDAYCQFKTRGTFTPNPSKIHSCSFKLKFNFKN